MIHTLGFDVRFTSSNLHYKGAHGFTEGLIAITGPNESGKSLVLEMIRYCLFGTEALRAPLKEYSTLQASLLFEVKDQIYKVARNKKGATLTVPQEEGDVLATGTSAVNTSIVSLLGFPLPVFDTVLASLQDESQKLTEMSPSARKQMVDSLTGLVGIQDVVSECRSRSNASKNMVTGLKEAYVVPLEPYEPLGYYPSPQVRQTLSVARELEADLASTYRLMQSPPPEPGDEPSIGTPSKAMETLVKTNDVVKEKINEYKQELAANPEPTYTMDELEEEEEKLQVAALDAQYPVPPLTQDEIDDMRVQWGRYHQVNQWHTLDKELTRLREGLLTCPSCDYQFSTEYDKILMYEEEMDNLSHVDLSEHFGNLKDEIFLDKWEAQWISRHQQPELAGPIRAPSLTIMELEKQVQFHGFDRERVKEWIKSHEAVYDPLVRDKFIKSVQQEKDHALWRAAKDAYQEWGIQAQEAQIDAQLIEKDLLQYKDIAELEQVLGEAIEYETLQTKYWDLKGQADALLARIEEESQKQDDWKTASSLVSQFSLEVKSYLLPSLSRVASSLMSVITGGARSYVKVSNDFEIFVDGQPVSTLSGSAKVAVNLALRVGLGQVLTSSTFPVFLADEVDASMDDTRASSTVQCIRNLTQTMRQVVIVSHKQVLDADQYIRMGDN